MIYNTFLPSALVCIPHLGNLEKEGLIQAGLPSARTKCCRWDGKKGVQLGKT